ncbi:MAG: SdrD B-like domain-containing protein [Thermoanaerobaculia bacterium]
MIKQLLKPTSRGSKDLHSLNPSQPAGVASSVGSSSRGLLISAVLALSALVPGVAAAQTIVQEFFVPLPETQVRIWADGIQDLGENETMRSVISMTVTADDAVVFWDQWENGYELDITAPLSVWTGVPNDAGTQIWGDQDCSNGAIPTVTCTVGSDDTLSAGDVIILQDDVPLGPTNFRDPSQTFFDGRDKFATTEFLAVTRALWPSTGVEAQLGGAVEVFDTSAWGTNYVAPMGENTANAAFEFVGLSIMAEEDGTLVSVDANGDGDFIDANDLLNVPLDMGESLLAGAVGVTDILVGAVVDASADVEIQMLTANEGTTYEGRWYSQLPRVDWSNEYFSPVPSTTSGDETRVHLYNPGLAAITVKVFELIAGVPTCTDQVVGAGATAEYTLSIETPLSAARFLSDGTDCAAAAVPGGDFFAIGSIDRNATIHDWGFTLIPTSSLTPTAVVGWAPGSTNLTENVSPVFVTPIDGTTDIYVDFDADPATGSLIDPFGNRYDQLFSGVVQLEAIRIFDQAPPDTNPGDPCTSGDCDQTGLRVYTVDGTRLTAAWGQDPAFSSSGQPQQLDMGTTVLPFSSLTAFKSGALLDDANNNGGLDPGETILYTIRVVNTGIVPITDIFLVDTLDPNTTYVLDSTQVDGAAIPDDLPLDTPFPLDVDAGHPMGYALVASPDELAPGAEILVTFVAQVNDPLPVGVEEIVNNVVVSSDTETFVDADAAPLRAGEITVTKTSSAAGSPVIPGQTITYTVTVENTSGSPVTGVELSDLLPAEVSYVAGSTVVTGPEQFFVRDAFELQSYANQEGPNDWSGNWLETDTAGPPQDPSAGDVQVFQGPANIELRMEDVGSAAARAVGDLRVIDGPDPFAALLFDFRVSDVVDTTDVIEIECASDGSGGTFGPVPDSTLDGIDGDVNSFPDGSLGYDISGCIAPPPSPPDTAVRFRVAANYGGAGEFFFADVVDVRAAGDSVEALDDFSSGYTGGTGVPCGATPCGWLIDWTETDAGGGGSGGGDVLVTAGELRLSGAVDNSAQREVDLSGSVFAILSFDYDTSEEINALGNADRMQVEVSSTGVAGTFTAIGEFVNDPDGSRSYDITPFISANTAVRFRISQALEGTEFFSVDNVRVKAGIQVVETKDNDGVALPDPPNHPELLDGAPPVITLPGDSFALAPGDVMTATFDVVADDPLDVPFLINTAIGRTFENPNPVQGQVTDFVSPGGAIGDLVWLDVDEDGYYDQFEPGLANVLVELRDGVCTPAVNCPTTLTNARGEYLFSHLQPGTYEVFVDETTIPTGLSIAPGSSNPISTIVITSTEVFLDVDFGYSPAPTLGALGDYVWNDSNGDGIQDPGELGISGVTVRLFDAATGTEVAGVSPVVTGADGKYLFTDVPPGEYYVQIDAAELAGGGDLDGYGATQGPQSIGTETSAPFTLMAGEAITDLDFGYANTCLPRIGFETDSGGFALASGQTIDDEFAKWGIAVSFTAAAPGTGPAMIFDSRVPTGGDTDLGSPNETCAPPGLGVGTGGELGQPGENCVPQGNILIISEDGDASDPDDNLNGGTLTFDFNYDVDVASIDFMDGNSPGNTVETFDAALMSLGTVAIADLGSNSFQNVAIAETGVRRLTVTLDDAGALAGIDFCAMPPLHPISDTVWLDENGDGKFAPGEQTIEGVTASLLSDPDGTPNNGDEEVIATAVSGTDGKFTFPLVPDGDYIIQIDDTDAKLTDLFGTTVPARAGQLPLTMAGAPISGVNFGYYAPGNIGDLVWNDTNDNGVRDPGESGIEGITLDLVDAATGVVITTATTAADGSYLFDNLPVGSYTVRVTDTGMLLMGFTQTGDPSEPGVKCTICDDEGSTTVTLNRSDLAQDFGYRNVSLPEVTGTVFFDPDRDGVLDSGEPGFEGVTVTLFDPGPDAIFGTNDDLIVAETTSASDGTYTFSDVPAGNFEVWVTDRAGILEGYTLTSGLEMIPITVAAMNVSGIDFGYIRDPGTASIGDTVWLDVNGDGVASASEPGLTRVTLDLIDVGPDGMLGTADDVGVVASTISDANGKYVLPDLPAGNYVVDVTDTNSILTNLTETAGTTDPSSVIRLSEGERFTDADFGYVPTAGTSVLGDRVWYDADGDGLQDPGEVGIEGIDVILVGPSCMPSCTVTTGPDGVWLAKNLTPGEYTVSFDDADVTALGYNTQPTNMTAPNDTYVVTTIAGDIITTLDFGFDGGTVGSIGDFIWIDEDGDGVQDAGEAGIEGVTVNLVDASGDIIATTTTDMSGNYLFAGVPDDATYTVVVSDINGVTGLLQQTGDPDEGGICSTCDMQGSVTIPLGGANIDTIDFGYAPSGGTGTISNLVWHDINRDGIQDLTEPGIEGVYVELWVDLNGNGTIEPGIDNRVRTEFTDVNGEYEFKSLPPEDYVVRVAPENFVAGAVLEAFVQTHDPNEFGMPCGTCDNLGDLTVVAGSGNFDQDFGYAGPLGAGLSISGTVFEDEDRSATLNGEPLVQSATMRLYRDLNGDGILDPAEPQIDVTTSDAAGDYTFTDLPPGDYIVTADTAGTAVEDFIQTTQQGGSFPENGVQPVTLVAANSTGNDFGFWNGGITTTPVTLAYFEARSGGSFRWMTSTEVGNLGFNLYAVTDEGLEKLNSELIASHVVDSLEPQTYEFEASGSAGKVFVLEDVDIHGQLRHHGPFYLDAARGSEVDRVKPVAWGKIRQQKAEKSRARAATRNALRRDAAAQDSRRGSGFIASAIGVGGGSDRCLACRPQRRSVYPTASLGADREGIYRVSYDDLAAAGLDFAGARRDWLALSAAGASVPMYVSPEPVFGPGSYIEFVGEPVDSLYTKTNVYRLSVNRRAAARVSELPFNGGGAAESFYLESALVENQVQYHFASPTDDPWYDLRLLAISGPVEASIPFDLEGWVPGAAPVALDVALFGGTDFPSAPDHHVVLDVNGSQVADELFDGVSVPELAFEVSDGALLATGNALEIELPHDTGAQYDLVNYDHLTVSYPRAFVAIGDALDFASEGSNFAVGGFGSSDVVAYARGEAGTSRLGVQVLGSPGAYEALFGSAGGLGEAAAYWTAAGAGILSPTIEEAAVNSDLGLRDLDVLVVSHADFIDSLAPWVALRESQGLAVKVVDVADLYSRFSHGVVDPESIRRYATAAYNHGVRSLLLVGGDTYDYFDYLGLGSVSFVPSLYAQTDVIVTYAPVDPLYGDVDGDLIPDMAVGRWPVRTTDELATVIAKTLAYSNADGGLSAVLAADGLDLGSGYSFASDSEDMAALLGPGWQIDRAYLDDQPVAEARQALIDGISAGPALTSYFGHSGLTVWSFDGLFKSDDVAELTNSGDPTIVTQWGCWNTYHVLPSFETLGNRLLLEPDTGAAAVLGAATLTEALSERRLGRRVFERLAIPGRSLGEAILEAKQDLAETDPGRLDVILGWTLLGDPTLSIVPEGAE